MDFQALQDYARQRIGIVNNNAIQQTELIQMLNLSLGSLDSLLATTYEDYRLTKFFASLGGGGPNQANPPNLIPLPPDFSKLRAIDYGAPGQWVNVYGFGLQERNRYNNPIANMYVPWGNQASRRARVMGQFIFIEPENIASGQYQVWYTPKFLPLVNPTDPLPVEMDTQDWVEYAVCSTGVKCYNKLLLNPQTFKEEMAYYEDRVRQAADYRMANGPQCMQNVRNLGDTSYPFSGNGWGA